jgi:uncharacterized protein (DUF58 family)
MRGEGSEFYGIREYQPGDPLRRVHWRSSARMGRLAVVEYEHDVSVDLTLVLDARRGSDVGEGVETTLETAAAVAASLARMVLEQGNRCRLLIPGVPVPRHGNDRGVEALHGILVSLARVRAEQEATSAEAVTAVLPELERESTLTLVTAIWDEASARAVTAAVDAGMSAMVVYIDPESFSGEGRSGVLAFRPSGGASRTPERLNARTPDAEVVREQVRALRARPVIVRRGIPLADQFAQSVLGRG